MSTYAYQRSVIEAAKFIRNFGKKVILDRQGAVLQGEDTPLDILAHILSVKEKQSTITNEDLVDDFVTFFCRFFRGDDQKWSPESRSRENKQNASELKELEQP